MAGKASLSHNHDDRYYTESEINNALNGKSDTSHVHRGIIIMAYGSHTMSCPGNDAAEGTLNITVPEGYSVLGILEAMVYYPSNLVITFHHIEQSGKIRYFIYNHSSNTITDNKTSFTVALIKTDYWV